MHEIPTSFLKMKTDEDKNEMKQKTDTYCDGLKLCGDGSCVSKIDLCPEEKVLNENTVLIMVIVGVAVIIAMIILYCFQHRSRRLSRNNQGALETIVGDGDNLSLDNPPPAYDEVISSNLYLPRLTPQSGQNRVGRLPSIEEPMTPPPNYDAALTILAQSNESFFPRKTEQRNSVFRRSVSTDTSIVSSPPTSPSAQQLEFRRNFSVNESR